MGMTLDEAIWREESLAYSFGERYKRLGEPVGELDKLEAEHRQMADWLKELKNYKTYVAKYPCEVCTYKSKVGCGRQTCIFKEVKDDEEGSDNE